MVSLQKQTRTLFPFFERKMMSLWKIDYVEGIFLIVWEVRRDKWPISPAADIFLLFSHPGHCCQVFSKNLPLLWLINSAPVLKIPPLLNNVLYCYLTFSWLWFQQRLCRSPVWLYTKLSNIKRQIRQFYTKKTKREIPLHSKKFRYFSATILSRIPSASSQKKAATFEHSCGKIHYLAAVNLGPVVPNINFLPSAK